MGQGVEFKALCKHSRGWEAEQGRRGEGDENRCARAWGAPDWAGSAVRPAPQGVRGESGSHAASGRGGGQGGTSPGVSEAPALQQDPREPLDLPPLPPRPSPLLGGPSGASSWPRSLSPPPWSPTALGENEPASPACLPPATRTSSGPHPATRRVTWTGPATCLGRTPVPCGGDRRRPVAVRAARARAEGWELVPGDPAWRRPPQSRSGIRGPRAGPCDPSGHPAGSRLQNSGALRRDGVQVGVAATPCPSSAGRALPLNCLLPALFATMPAAGSPQTRHSRRGPEAARDTAWGVGGRSSPPRPVRRPEARPRLLGSAAAGLLLLPASWLQSPHVPTEPKLRGPSKPPMCGGRRGRPPAPATTRPLLRG